MMLPPVAFIKDFILTPSTLFSPDVITQHSEQHSILGITFSSNISALPTIERTLLPHRELKPLIILTPPHCNYGSLPPPSLYPTKWLILGSYISSLGQSFLHSAFFRGSYFFEVLRPNTLVSYTYLQFSPNWNFSVFLSNRVTKQC